MWRVNRVLEIPALQVKRKILNLWKEHDNRFQFSKTCFLFQIQMTKLEYVNLLAFFYLFINIF